jgi:hypothetical protein
MASYALPFGRGHKIGQGPVLSRLLGGWTLSPIFSWASGLPINFATGSYQEQGQAWDGDLSASAIPIGTAGVGTLGNTQHYGINAAAGSIVAVNGNQANGGSGVNMFSNPNAVFNEFRPFILGTDTRTGGAGTVYGQHRYNLDLGLTKDTQFTERVGAQIFVQAFNVVNHMQWADPSMSLQDPQDFGVLSGQYGALTLGGAGASANYTRIVQLGLRLHF